MAKDQDIYKFYTKSMQSSYMNPTLLLPTLLQYVMTFSYFPQLRFISHFTDAN